MRITSQPKLRVLLRERLDVHDIFHPAINLQAIAVDDADQVVEVEVSGFHGRFPNLALLLFAVAHEAEDLVLLVVELGSQRDADGDAQTLAQRPGGDFNAGQLEPMRMALIGRAQLAQGHDVLDAGKSRQRQAQGRGWAPCVRWTR